MSVQILLLVIWQLLLGAGLSLLTRSLSRVIKNLPKGAQSQSQAEGSSVAEPSIPALTDLRSLPSSSGLLQRSVGPSGFQGPGEEDEVMPYNQSSLTQELHLHDARSLNTVQVAYVVSIMQSSVVP